MIVILSSPAENCAAQPLAVFRASEEKRSRRVPDSAVRVMVGGGGPGEALPRVQLDGLGRLALVVHLHHVPLRHVHVRELRVL